MSVILNAVEVEVALRRVLSDLNERDRRRAEGVRPDVLAREVASLQCVKARVGLSRRSDHGGRAVRLQRPVDNLEVLREEAVAHVLVWASD